MNLRVRSPSPPKAPLGGAPTKSPFHSLSTGWAYTYLTAAWLTKGAQKNWLMCLRKSTSTAASAVACVRPKDFSQRTKFGRSRAATAESWASLMMSLSSKITHPAGHLSQDELLVCFVDVDVFSSSCFCYHRMHEAMHICVYCTKV